MDSSSFILIEGSGDSEVDCEFLKLCFDIIKSQDKDDDAESSNSGPTYFKENNEDFYVGDQDCRIIINGTKEVHWSNCKNMGLGDNIGGQYVSIDVEDGESNVGIKLSREVVDQMEDKLFWETCMAIGYPQA